MSTALALIERIKVSMLQVRFEYAFFLSLTSWPLFLWINDLVGSYCAFSGFIVGFAFAHIVEKQADGSKVFWLGVVMAMIAMTLSGFLRPVMETILGGPVRDLSYYLGSAFAGFMGGIWLMGIPPLVFALTNYFIWKAGRYAERERS